MERRVEELRNGGIGFFAEIVEEVLCFVPEGHPASVLEFVALDPKRRPKAHLVEVETAPLCSFLARVTVVHGEEALSANSCEIVDERVRAEDE